MFAFRTHVRKAGGPSFFVVEIGLGCTMRGKMNAVPDLERPQSHYFVGVRDVAVGHGRGIAAVGGSQEFFKPLGGSESDFALTSQVVS